MEPQYTTDFMPALINCFPFSTRAFRSGLPFSLHGVIKAGMQPLKTFSFSTINFQKTINVYLIGHESIAIHAFSEYFLSK